MPRNVNNPANAIARTNKPTGDSDRYAAVDGLTNVVAGLGGSQDKRSFTTWTYPSIITRAALENMYRVSWLAKRVINTVAEDMTRAWRVPKFQDKDTNAAIEAIEKEEKRLQVQSKIYEALCWSRLYGGSVLLMSIKGQQNLRMPLDVTKIKKGDLVGLHVLDRWRLSGNVDLDLDITSRNFGLPLYYMLAESSVEVHWTRMIRFNGQKLPYFSWQANARWDDSELQHVLDSLMNVDTTSAGIASMVFEANIDVVSSGKIADLLGTKGGEAKILKRFQVAAQMKSFNHMLLLDAEEKYEKKGNNFANLDKILEKFQIDVCGAADIPMTRLFGQSAAGLNATGAGDLRNYYNMIGSKQATSLAMQLEQLDQVLVRSAIGLFPDDYENEFEPLWQMSDSDNATLEYNNAQRDQIYLNAGVVTEGLVASQLKIDGIYHSMSDADVQLAEELSAQPDALPPIPDGPVPNKPAPGNKNVAAQKIPVPGDTKSTLRKNVIKHKIGDDEHETI